jgi:hypothetical protein
MQGHGGNLGRAADNIGSISLVIIAIFCVAFIVIAFAFAIFAPAHSRDDGRYSQMDPKIHSWFDQLASGKGLCCSFADGFSIHDVDWDTHKHCVEGPSTDEMNCKSQYRVYLHGEWIEVPDNAVVTEPNRFGPAVVWPYLDAEGATQIRCFLPGAQS